MDTKQVSNSGGLVRIGDLSLYVQQLELRLEQSLLDGLRKIAKEASGDYLRAVEPMLDRLARMKTTEAAARSAIIIETVARMEAKQEFQGIDAVIAASKTPKGAALELWYRARAGNPNLQLRDLEAVIVDAEIALDVHFQIQEALGAKDDTKSEPAGSGNRAA